MATIANGQSLSDELPIKGGFIITVDGWTAAVMTFQVQGADGTYRDLYDEFGTEVQVATFTGGQAVALPVNVLGSTSIKVRSGTTGAPVNQGGARTVLTVR